MSENGENPPMTLRSLAIEAIAPQLHANDPAYSPPYWDDCTEDMKTWYRNQATFALDALLDVLTEHANAWIAEADWMVRPEDMWARDMIGDMLAAPGDTTP